MRIAYVTETYPPEINGVALTVQRCVRHLRRSGHQVLLVRPSASPACAGRTSSTWWPLRRRWRTQRCTVSATPLISGG